MDLKIKYNPYQNPNGFFFFCKNRIIHPKILKWPQGTPKSQNNLDKEPSCRSHTSWLQNLSQSSIPDKYRSSLSAKNQEQESSCAPECIFIHSKVYLLSPIKNQKLSLSNRENKQKSVIFCLVKINKYKAKTYRKCYEWNKFVTLMKTKGRRGVLLCQICWVHTQYVSPFLLTNRTLIPFSMPR